MKRQSFLVNIRLMTYNHAACIQEAMDGIVMQKTDFPVKVIVGDDFSTDNTLKIIKGYNNTKNITFKILERLKGDSYWKKRQQYGRLYNFVNIMEHCDGKYIALLDGDDYWTDPLKLQKQVDFMEKNRDFGLVHTAYNTYFQDKDIFKQHKRNNELQTWPEFEDLLVDNSIATLTTFVRQATLDKVFSFYKQIIFNNNWPMGDYPLWLLIAKESKVGYLNDVTSVYRKRSGSLSAHSNYANRKIFFEKSLELRKYFVNRYELSTALIDKIKRAHIIKLFSLAWKFREWDEILTYYKQMGWKALNLKRIAICLLALRHKLTD